MSKSEQFLAKISKLSVDELLKESADLTGQLKDLRFTFSFGKLNNLAQIKKLQKQLAQIKTIISAKNRETSKKI